MTASATSKGSPSQNCASRCISGVDHWAGLANRHLKRYGHTSSIDERTLRAQGSKKIPTLHKGVRLKAKSRYLDKIRPKQPRPPLVQTTKQRTSAGGIPIQASISQTALNRIKADPNGIAPTIKKIIRSSSSGWPPAPVADWTSWGHRLPARFFAKWPERGGNGPAPMGGMQL